MDGPTLQAKRLSRKIPRQVLAPYAGVHPLYLLRHERGKTPRSFTSQTLERLEEGVTVIPMMQHDRLIELRDRGQAMRRTPIGELT